MTFLRRFRDPFLILVLGSCFGWGGVDMTYSGMGSVIVNSFGWL
jgi:hypothetical protein